MNLKLF